MKILIVEDDLNFARTLELEFTDAGDEVVLMDDPEKALSIDEEFSHIILDLRVKTKSSLDYISQIRSKFKDSRIVVLTGFGSISTTVDAVKNGADDYLTKPIKFSVLRNTLLGEKEAIKEEISAEEMSLDRNEREYIEYVLNKYDGNITKAANALGLHRQSLQRKLKKYTPNK